MLRHNAGLSDSMLSGIAMSNHGASIRRWIRLAVAAA